MVKKTRLLTVAFVVGFLLIPTQVALPATTKWTAKYWNNVSLSGSADVERTENEIDKDWGHDNPVSGIGADNFSVRWKRTAYFDSGTYRFVATADDGMRVWVDGDKIIDMWYDHGPIIHTADVKLSKGDHEIKVEYYERGGGAVAKLMWSEAPLRDQWRATFFNNKTLSGDPVKSRKDDAIDFDWGTGRPASDVDKNNFSARWDRTVYFEAGTYRFTATADDGMRVWVDSNKIIDMWYDHTPITIGADVSLGAGDHWIRVEYYDDDGGAVAKFWWSASAAPTPIVNWQGEYYNNNVALSGMPSLVRDDAAIDFDWGSGSPAPGVINTDFFSARWTRTVYFEAGTYRFTATSDDGVRVWVDDSLIIDRWTDHAVQTVSADVTLGAGDHRIKVEYYENAGLAVAKLNWSLVTGSTPGGTTSGGSTSSGSTSGGTIILDNGGAGFQSGGPASDWFTMTDGYGSSSLWSHNAAQISESYNWARWYPNLPAGRYEVYVYIPAQNATARTARYWVRTFNAYMLKIVDQWLNRGRWVTLGTYSFGGVSYEFVSLADVTYEASNTTRVAFDAVKWEPR